MSGDTWKSASERPPEHVEVIMWSPVWEYIVGHWDGADYVEQQDFSRIYGVVFWATIIPCPAAARDH